MKKTLIFGGITIAAIAIISGAIYCIMNKSNTRTITVVGECLTTAPRDRTAITLRVKTLDVNAAVSMKKATDAITEITDFLKTQDVKMQTIAFDSYEKNEWDSATQKSIILGIETNIAIEVSADKTEKIEIILNKFSGMENIYSENFHMFTAAETLKPIMEKCLGESVKNARQRANAIALGDGARVKKMISAEYNTSNNNDFRPSNYMRKSESVMMDGASAGGGLVSRDTDVSVSVLARFSVK